MAKIAVELEQALKQRALNGDPGHTMGRVLAQGKGWTVEDVICTSGPHDRPFEEQHSHVSIAIVAAGTFQYRASTDRSQVSCELMTPGSLLLGNAGQPFECGHEHGMGDRCLAFRYTQDHFECLATDVGALGRRLDFPFLRLPPSRVLSPLVARACTGMAGSLEVTWEELSVKLVAQTLQLVGGLSPEPEVPAPSALARVTRSVRAIERHADAELSLESLAREAGLSRYHFLRTFERLTGVTPHQYVLRTRLREAAMRLTLNSTKILDVALDCGFGDVSNFNRAFRGEFGVSPRVYRQTI